MTSAANKFTKGQRVKALAYVYSKGWPYVPGTNKLSEPVPLTPTKKHPFYRKREYRTVERVEIEPIEVIVIGRSVRLAGWLHESSHDEKGYLTTGGHIEVDCSVPVLMVVLATPERYTKPFAVLPQDCVLIEEGASDE